MSSGWRVDLSFPAEGLPVLDEVLSGLGGALVTGGPDARGTALLRHDVEGRLIKTFPRQRVGRPSPLAELPQAPVAHQRCQTGA